MLKKARITDKTRDEIAELVLKPVGEWRQVAREQVRENFCAPRCKNPPAEDEKFCDNAQGVYQWFLELLLERRSRLN